jgi:hypothetical protein
MIVLLQSYQGVSDAEAVELTVVDLRWQMVLDRLGATTPACGQGTLVDFRGRLIRTDMDRRLLERTVELAWCTNFQPRWTSVSLQLQTPAPLMELWRVWKSSRGR